MVSNELALTLLRPPKPFQRATGTMHSRPARSANSASVLLLSQLASQRSGALVKASPPEQSEPNSPSLGPAVFVNTELRMVPTFLLLADHNDRLIQSHGRIGNVPPQGPLGVDLVSTFREGPFESRPADERPLDALGSG